ncbi:MAG TPA: DUF1428 domain-containing protein [Myxococcota bacterium]
MKYVDGFVLAVPKANIEAYKKIAADAAKLWKEYGAIDYVEAMGDDVPDGKLTSFPLAVKATADEVVFFSWITFASREERDRINKRVMEDPRMKMDPASNPFDMKRMIFGGFVPVVQ